MNKKIEKSFKKFNKRLHDTNEFLMSTPRMILRRLSWSGSHSGIPFQSNDNISASEDLDFSLDIDQDNQIQASHSSFLDIFKDECDDSLGLFSLPLQIQRKILKTTFPFTIMIVGQSGMGKSTFINSFFMCDIYNENVGPTKPVQKTLSIESTSVILQEDKVKVLLTVVDTPGFGDFLNNNNCWQSIEKFIQERHSKFLESEIKSTCPPIDQRVHCCLYFIQPTGQSLKPIDIEFMKNLHDKVNLIPVIAKADTLTKDELAQFKKNIRNDLKENSIEIFDFPPQEEVDCSELVERMPFAIVSSNYICEQDGFRFFGRKYPWGTVNVENPDHSDLKVLQELIIRRYMCELVDRTHRVHYEYYRSQNLKAVFSKTNNFF